MTRLTKRMAEAIHAKRRALERYGVTLNRAHLAAMVRQIQTNRATFLARQSLRITAWRVEQMVERQDGLELVEMVAVYDRRRAQIVTFLPPGTVPRGPEIDLD